MLTRKRQLVSDAAVAASNTTNTTTTRRQMKARTTTTTKSTNKIVMKNKGKINVNSGKRGKRRIVKNVASDDNDDDDIKDHTTTTTTHYYCDGYKEQICYMKQLLENLLHHNKANSVIICGDTGMGKNALIEHCFESFPIITGGSGGVGVGNRRLLDNEKFSHLKIALFEFDGNLHGKNELATLRLIGNRLNQLVEERDRQIVLTDDDDEEEEDDDEQDWEEEEDSNKDKIKKANTTMMANKISNSIPMIMEQFRFLIQNCPNFRAVIILDNLEVFSYRQQYLLYNLFDLIQHGRSVLIIGLTRRLDCIQLLTSRVQSRLNRRMIHLVSPFATLDTYLEYARKLCQQQINNKLELDTELKNELIKAYSLNQSFTEMKRIIQQYSFKPSQPPPNSGDASGGGGDSSTNNNNSAATIFLRKDFKILDLCNLTRHELFLLIITNHQLANHQTDTFTCRELHEWTRTMPQLKLQSLRFEHILKLVYKMMELDLIITAKECNHNVSSSRKVGQLWLTPWTSLMLNISEMQLQQLIDSLGNKLPSYIRQYFR